MNFVIPIFYLTFISTTRSTAIIGNNGMSSTVILGVRDEGNLNVPYQEVNELGIPAMDPLGIGLIGIRTGMAAAQGLEAGDPRDHWSLYVDTIDTFVYACSGNCPTSGSSPETFGLMVDPFIGSNGGSTASSKVTESNEEFTVEHEFIPSSISQFVYNVTVTITNTGITPFNEIIYRRQTEWDPNYPPNFLSLQTIFGWGTSAELFRSGNILSVITSELINLLNPSMDIPPWNCDVSNGDNEVNVNLNRFGVCDQGSVMDFNLGGLEPGEFLQFILFYGVAPGRDATDIALESIGAEAYSIGEIPVPAPDSNTWFFGFLTPNACEAGSMCDCNDNEKYDRDNPLQIFSGVTKSYCCYKCNEFEMRGYGFIQRCNSWDWNKMSGELGECRLFIEDPNEEDKSIARDFCAGFVRKKTYGYGYYANEIFENQLSKTAAIIKPYEEYNFFLIISIVIMNMSVFIFWYLRTRRSNNNKD